MEQECCEKVLFPITQTSVNFWEIGIAFCIACLNFFALAPTGFLFVGPSAVASGFLCNAGPGTDVPKARPRGALESEVRPRKGSLLC